VHEPIYYSVPQGELDPQFDAIIQTAFALRKANGVIL